MNDEQKERLRKISEIVYADLGENSTTRWAVNCIWELMEDELKKCSK